MSAYSFTYRCRACNCVLLNSMLTVEHSERARNILDSIAANRNPVFKTDPTVPLVIAHTCRAGELGLADLIGACEQSKSFTVLEGDKP